jgi:hypothetical protein
MKHRLLRVLVPGAGLLLLGQCGLSDQQLTAIAQSAVSSGLNTLITQALTVFVAGLGAGA